ncbi:alpha-amylase family glycosyl hydrolase [Fimbriimonas ginsengisoli]|uniref:Alpha amylase n=1 Tax=Fimbriimonas ginsengisoli Gsoil 348 TaxID=661478 RepID=A0A068NTA3_FIMGI|nr:alpha-amylase family glycosyl hydrolase [Fimbriimonas ginsengisoli]AIE86783.1 alpha amylase [Fimbriimonas ginsengisoli Gsoil 348]
MIVPIRKGVKLGRSLRTLAAIAGAFVIAQTASAGVLLQGFYWDVPSPAAGSGSAPWWWDKLAGQANSLKLSGFTAVWIPPVLKGAAGGYSVGYDPFDDYDIGSKSQQGTIPTRYGTREQLERCCAMLRANSLDIYCDIVDNHRNGDPGNYQFSYLDAYGVANGGRFGKGQWDFHPNVSQDPNVPVGASEDFNAFGRDLAPINGPSNWIFNGLNSSGDWVTKALDLQGYRLDYVKGISTNWLSSFLNYGAMSGKFAVGEYFDSNLGSIQYWISTMMGNRASAFDFPLRDQLKGMCNSPGSFNMANLDHAGLAGVDPAHAVTFVENHDTDRSDAIFQNKALAYAYILTSEGYPSVFYKDYSTDAGCYGMKPTIDNLMWVHEKLASGTTTQRYKNNLVFVYERNGGQHLLVGLNNNTGFGYNLTCATGFGANRQLHDYTGHAPDVWTDGSGNVSLSLPTATNGMGYVAYAPVGIGGSFTASQLSTTQEYAGATDLDIKPADNTALVQVCRINVAAGKSISGALYFTTTSWTASTNIYLELDNPSGGIVTTKTYTTGTAQGAALTATASTAGWYTFKIRSNNTPAGNLKPTYWLRATYTAPQT